jgi:hypothetical protein
MPHDCIKVGREVFTNGFDDVLLMTPTTPTRKTPAICLLAALIKK